MEGGSIIKDSEFTERMLKFHRKVNPKEGLIGFYKTGSEIDESTLIIYDYYLQLLRDPKNKGLLTQPLLFLIDPTMQTNRLTIKVSIISSRRVCLGSLGFQIFLFTIKTRLNSALSVKNAYSCCLSTLRHTKLAKSSV